ncbi:MAG TPA: permease prefix domain 1-containing protein [Bacillales bacterium]|nr:permease prefix domain 1-containing protein [Bacillales bacterium]
MTPEKQRYLEELKKALGAEGQAEAVVKEINSHIEERMHDRMVFGIKEEEALDEALQSLGSPRKLAKALMEGEASNRHTMRNVFIACNYLFFLGGTMLMIFSQILTLPIVHTVWESLTGVSGLILACYTGYWFYLGYEVGKQFGPNGKSLMNRTVLMSLIPNVLLMFLTLFRFIPQHLFNSMLTPEFVTVCVVATVFFYPISKAAYKIGVVHGV